MPRPFHVQLVTPQGVRYDNDAVYLRLPAEDGYFGIMADHAPLIAALVPGQVSLHRPGTPRPDLYASSGGVVEVTENQTVVLADTLETPEEIDEQRAREAAERARDRLQARTLPEFDESRALGALQRALVRLQVAGKRAAGGGL